MEALEFSNKSTPVETVIMCAMTVLDMYFYSRKLAFNEVFAMIWGNTVER